MQLTVVELNRRLNDSVQKPEMAMVLRRRWLKATCLLAGTLFAYAGYGQQPAITLVGSVPTASPAQTIGINGNTVYACDNNEISVIDVTRASAPVVLGSLASPVNTTNTFCDVQRSDLVQMLNTTPPVFRAYSLSNPASPSLIGSTTVNKQFFGPPYFEGNTAYFGTNEIVFGSGYPGPVTDQAGDFVSMDITNLSAPAVLATVESQTHGPVAGGSFNVYGTAPYSAQLVYLGSTTSQGGATQTGVGQLWAVDTTNPSAMSILTQINVPGTLQVFTPLIQGNILVTIGDSGGWIQPCCGNNAFTGNVVITVFDLSNPRSPQIKANVTTSYKPGPAIGRGAAVIGQNLFLYGGVLDSGNNNNFLLVDATNPTNPVITLSATSTSVNYLRVVGTQLYAPTDAGLQIYSISGSPAPVIRTNGIVPVDSTVSTVQPGEWISIYGSNLGPATPVNWNGNFPTQLGGTSVTIDGIAAYLYYVSAGQVNVQVPDDPNVDRVVPVVVNVGSQSVTSSVRLAAVAPSFALLGDNLHVAGIILRTDGSGAYGNGTYDIIGPTGTSFGYKTVAAKAGDAIELFGFGFGPTSPAVPSGGLFSGSAATTNVVTLKIGNTPVVTSFTGISLAGTYQFNLTVPAGLGTGDISITASVASVSTTTGEPNAVIALQ
ncbi:MAG TPA: hypothetical protein VGH38_19285 [Bryobacteraceae bacterium]